MSHAKISTALHIHSNPQTVGFRSGKVMSLDFCVISQEWLCHRGISQCNTHDVLLTHLFVYNVKRTGELTHFWGAPVLIDLGSGNALFTFTCRTLLVKEEKYHLIIKEFTFICFIVSRNK